MSRFKRFAHSLVSGYVLLGANILYTLVSLPLALKYLSLAEFGLWQLTVQVSGYIAMIDLGMNSSVGRILIDKKDHPQDGGYGGAIKTGALVGITQGAMILVAGLSLVWVLPRWLNVKAELTESFFWLMVGQVMISAATFATRTFGQVLYAWQRMDIINYALVFQFAVWLSMLWTGLELGFGVYSMLLSSSAGFVSTTLICAVACHKLALLPKRGQWGKVSRGQFRELFSYGADIFLIAFGAQLILSSQVLLVTRTLGMEAVAVWSVMTKTFTLLLQIVTRFISNAMPAFAEMMVRGERRLLWERYRALFTTATVLSGVCGVLLAAGNSLFVSVWMNRKIAWPVYNDALLAIWLVVLVQQCCHGSLITCRKQVYELKYAYLIEGLVFILASLITLPRAGLTGMLVCSVLCTLVFTWANSTYRVARLIHQEKNASLWHWLSPVMRVLLVMVPCWLAVARLLQGRSALIQLMVLGGALAVAGLVAIRFALPRSLATELVGRLPQSFQRLSAVFVR